MLELKERIEQMIQHGGTEEDLFAVVAHIDNEFLEKEKKHLMEAWDNGDHCIDLPDGSWEQKYKSPEDYYNRNYENNL